MATTICIVSAPFFHIFCDFDCESLISFNYQQKHKLEVESTSRSTSLANWTLIFVWAPTECKKKEREEEKNVLLWHHTKRAKARWTSTKRLEIPFNPNCVINWVIYVTRRYKKEETFPQFRLENGKKEFYGEDNKVWTILFRFFTFEEIEKLSYPENVDVNKEKH